MPILFCEIHARQFLHCCPPMGTSYTKAARSAAHCDSEFHTYDDEEITSLLITNSVTAFRMTSDTALCSRCNMGRFLGEEPQITAASMVVERSIKTPMGSFKKQLNISDILAAAAYDLQDSDETDDEYSPAVIASMKRPLRNPHSNAPDHKCSKSTAARSDLPVSVNGIDLVALGRVHAMRGSCFCWSCHKLRRA